MSVCTGETEELAGGEGGAIEVSTFGCGEGKGAIAAGAGFGRAASGENLGDSNFGTAIF